MRTIARLLNARRKVAQQTMWKLIAIFTVICAGANAAACEKYDLSATTLSGTVTIETFFGPPNYGESPATDSREQQAILHLLNPLCTVASGDDPAERDQVKVTLVPTGKFSLRPFAGKLVTVNGSLFHAINGHHHTPILVAISQVPKVLHSTRLP
jgi:hypothetical protein